MTITQEISFEENIEAHLLGHGWRHVTPDAYDKKLGLFPDEVIGYVRDTQPNAWKELCRKLGGEIDAREKLLNALAKAIDHRGTVSVLRGQIKLVGVPIRMVYFKPATTLVADAVRRYDLNRLAVVRQVHYSLSQPHKSLDMVLVVNGVPTATVELKNPMSGQGVEQAMIQYRTDRNPSDLIFRSRALVHFAVDPHQVFMTTELKGQDTHFLPFNQGSNGPGRRGASGNPPANGYQTAYLWEQVWQRDAWLDLIENFIHTTKSGRLFPRFHQWHAVRSLLAATRRDGAGVDRLIQHSAGSGKSNTIAWSAHSLSRLHDETNQPIFDKVIVITDRKVLDRQLQDTVAGVEHTQGTVVRIDRNSAQLKEALESAGARIIITTMQKFPVVMEMARKAEAAGEESAGVKGSRFAIIVDEAHSSTGGDQVKQMKGVLSNQLSLDEAEAEQQRAEEAADASDLIIASAQQRTKNSNLSFFAFTATPKPKTLNLFGQLGDDGNYHPFHVYSMRQAIDEGFILDVLRNYTTYGVYYKLANTQPSKDVEVDAKKAKVVLARFASLHDYQMSAKAEVIVEHFRQKVAHQIDGKAKAMVVTRSRLHALKTYDAICDYVLRKGYDRGPKPIRILVAFSGSVVDPQVPEKTWTEPEKNGFPESQLPKRFHSDEFQILVVADKYQTGFDEPLLHTMYVDKKLAGVAAVQTLSRLNRTCAGKTETFVLDFANTAEEIQAAFEPFYEESLAAPADPQTLYTLQAELVDANILVPSEVEQAADLLLEGAPDSQAELYALVGRAVGRYGQLDEERQHSFRETLNRFIRAYGFLAQVMSWTDTDLEQLYLYGKVLHMVLPSAQGEPLPQVSESVQLTHLRLEVTSDDAIELEADEEPGVALPGEGEGSAQEPLIDTLSAVVEMMNEKFGAGLTEADKLFFEQGREDIRSDDTMRAVAQGNDRDNYRLVLEQEAAQRLLSRSDRNAHLVDLFFANSEMRRLYVDYLMTTFDEFVAESR